METKTISPIAMTVARAALLFEVTPQAVRNWIAEGKLEKYSRMEGAPVLVTTKSVERLLAERESWVG